MRASAPVFTREKLLFHHKERRLPPTLHAEPTCRDSAVPAGAEQVGHVAWPWVTVEGWEQQCPESAEGSPVAHGTSLTWDIPGLSNCLGSGKWNVCILTFEMGVWGPIQDLLCGVQSEPMEHTNSVGGSG